MVYALALVVAPGAHGSLPGGGAEFGLAYGLQVAAESGGAAESEGAAESGAAVESGFTAAEGSPDGQGHAGLPGHPAHDHPDGSEHDADCLTCLLLTLPGLESPQAASQPSTAPASRPLAAGSTGEQDRSVSVLRLRGPPVV